MSYKAKCGAGVVMMVITCFILNGNVFAWEDPTATFTFGSSTNTNIFNKPEEVADKINDVGLKVTLPHTLKKKQTKLNFDLNYRQDWKQEQEKINSRTSTVKFGLTHVHSKKLILQAAYQYQDFESFISSGVNLVLSPKFTKTNSAKIDYAYAKRRFSTAKLNATNQVIKLDYKVQLTPKTALTPFFSYELNSVPASLGSEYKGTTAGLRYEWKMSGKTTLTTSYDLRVRDYLNPASASITNISSQEQINELKAAGWNCPVTTACVYPANVTRVEKRGQLSFGVKYVLQKNADLNVKYIHYKNNADSTDPGSKFGASKSYDADIFSVSVSIKSLKAKKPKKVKEEEKKDATDKDDD